MLVLFRLVGRRRKLDIDFVAGLIKRQPASSIDLLGALLGLARLGCPSFLLGGGRLGFRFAIDGIFRGDCRFQGGRFFDPLTRLRKLIAGRRTAHASRALPCVRPRNVDSQRIVGQGYKQLGLPALILEFQLGGYGKEDRGRIIAAPHHVGQHQPFADEVLPSRNVPDA